MIEVWDGIGLWYPAVQYICYAIIAYAIVVVIFDKVKSKRR